jgi:protein O-mannosyl-transferase
MLNNIFSYIKSLYRSRPLIFIPLFLFLLTFVTYVNILPNKLFFDDEELIYKNAYVADLKYLPKYFTENMIAGAGKLSNMYRPLLLVTFAFDHVIWGNNPIGFHLTSIVLHGLNSILVFFLLYLLFKNKMTAFLASVLFSIHPSQSEAVIYASGRTDPLFSFFALLSIICFILFIKTTKHKTILFSLSCLFSILSLLSKETAVILPFLLTAVYLNLNKEKDWDIKKLLVSIQPFFLFSIIYIVFRLTFLNFSNTLNFYTEANIYSQNLLFRLYTFTRVFFEYLKILFFPKNLIVARSIQIITNPLNPYTIAFAILTSVFMIISIMLRRLNNIFLFSFVWFFITIAPVSGIIPINNIITEHYLYLPSLAFFLFIGYVFTFILKVSDKPLVKNLTVFVFIALSGLLITRTIIRTFDWRDAITFYTVSLKQSPWHIPMRNNLAMAYSEAGKTDIAIREYQKVIEIGDYYPNTHHNLANVYKSQGKFKEAEAEYKKALTMNPNFYFSLYGLADLYKLSGEKTKLDEVMKVINTFTKK